MKVKSILSGSLQKFLLITFILIEIAGFAYGIIRYTSESARIKLHHKTHNISNVSLQIRLKQNLHDTIFQFVVFTVAISFAGGLSIVIYRKQVNSLKVSIDAFSSILTESVKKREKMILPSSLDYKEFHKITSEVNDVLEEIHYKENYNYLTKLPKKQRFIKDSLALLETGQYPVIVAYIYLKDYKNLLKSQNFQIADKVIVVLAERLKKFASSMNGAIIGKISGNGDFLLSFPCEKYPDTCYDLISKKLNDCFSQKIDFGDDGVFEQGVNIGFGLLTHENENEILDNTYKAAILSTTKKDTMFCSYTDEIKTQLDIQAKLENDLKDAVENEKLEVFYQAKICAKNDNVSSAEALVRWRRAGGFENTERFIKVAEKSDLIIKLEKLVIKKVFNDQRKLQDMGIFIPISINLSAKHLLHQSFLYTLDEFSSLYKIDPKYIELEITERQKLDDKDSLYVLDELKFRGYNISLDDFGKDYSSLSYINHLPIDSIKIDKSFIDGIFDTSSSKAIINGVIAIAKNIGKKIIAEGVETKEQVEYLKSVGCDELQGFYYHQGACSLEDFLKVYDDRIERV